MRKVLLTAVAATAMLGAGSVMAQDQSGSRWYGNIGYGNVSAESSDIDFDALNARVGARFTPYVGVEGELGIGLGDQEVTPGVDASLNYDAAAYVVGFVPITERFEVLGRVGYGVTEMEVEGPGGFTVSEDGDSLNYGLGAQYFFDDANGVRADWTRRDFQDDGGEADAWTINYVRRF